MQENSKEKLKIKGGEKNTAGLKRETGAEARENISPVCKKSGKPRHNWEMRGTRKLVIGWKSGIKAETGLDISYTRFMNKWTVHSEFFIYFALDGSAL